jgi:hypothetical protein
VLLGHLEEEDVYESNFAWRSPTGGDLICAFGMQLASRGP